MADNTGLGAFIDHDNNGKPFMGIDITTSITREQIYIGDYRAAVTLIEGLRTVAEELKKMPAKTVLDTNLNGVNVDALRSRK